MKNDKLEKFIMENRQDFDNFEPNEQVWDGVLQSMKPVRKLKWTTIALRVAAVVVIFIASCFFHDLLHQNKNAEITEDFGEQPSEQMQMLLEAEVFYTSQIKTAHEEFFRLSGNNKELMEDINSDLKELDNVFEELKNDLRDQGDNQEVIEAMVQNYRIKLQILEDMLGQMNKVRQTKNKTNEHEI
jgi:hypothetical protein